MATHTRVMTGVVSDFRKSNSLLPTWSWDLVTRLASTLMFFSAMRKLGVINRRWPRSAATCWSLPGNWGSRSQDEQQADPDRGYELCSFVEMVQHLE